MNAPANLIIDHLKAEIRAFARLAHTQNRIAVQRANWAREARQQGKPHLADRYAREALKLRGDAFWSLDQAWMRKGVKIDRS